MKKILLLLFFVISTFIFSEWKVGYNIGKTTAVDYNDEELSVWVYKDRAEYIHFKLNPEELKKVRPTFNTKELNRLPFVDKVKAYLKIDSNDEIIMNVYMNVYGVSNRDKEVIISLDATDGKESTVDEIEYEKIKKIGEQMTKGKQLKVTFVKGKNIVVKTYGLKAFKERFEEAKKKNN